MSKKLYIGCGKDRREGFIHADIRNMPGVDIVCNPWEISKHITDVDYIYSRHMLEHLTSMEADAALIDWHNALKISGEIYIVVPNMDYHAEQWLRAEWSEETLHDRWSDARHGFSGLYGWQQECNPLLDDYNNSYWDVHKSGYNERRIKFLLERTGFVNIKTEIKNNIHLVVTAQKSMNRGERQIAKSYKKIRQDHKNRYDFSIDILSHQKPKSVLDLAAGIGYGSLMLAHGLDCSVMGVDIDSGAIDYARENFSDDRIEYLCEDARSINITEEFDAIVSFETVEHIDFPFELFKKFHRALKKNGTFIFSTPNENIMPFSKEKFRFHLKHYTVEEIQSLCEKTGFLIEKIYTQHDPKQGEVVEGSDGCFLIAVCKKLST